jgi:hypothetical protein
MLAAITGVIEHFRPAALQSSGSEIEEMTVIDVYCGPVTDSKPRKRVHFHERILVVTIPSLEEYRKCGCDLWWTSEEMKATRKRFHKEIIYEMQIDPSLRNVYDTIKKLCRSPIYKESMEVTNINVPRLIDSFLFWMCREWTLRVKLPKTK